MKAIIVCGTPGAGKSTYAKDLALRNRACLLDVDTVGGQLVEAALKVRGGDPCDRDSPYYKEAFREPLYRTMFELARENLAWTDVVLVGPFTKEIQDPTWPAQLAAALDARVEVHYLHCPPALRKVRMQERNLERDRAKLADWDSYLLYYGEEAPPAFPHIFVDTSAASKVR